MKKLGHFKGFWSNSAEAARLMRRGVVVQSIWAPALVRLRGAGVQARCAVPVEGARGWHADLCLSIAAEGEVRDAAYEYLNWWMNGWAGSVIARQGYYMAVPSRARRHLSAEEWAYWYEGKPAEIPLADPHGTICIRPGDVREGGSHLERMNDVRVWNTFMDEYTYLAHRWRELMAA
jgi:putative spermidine/putrescine transport system substrate-binding protein